VDSAQPKKTIMTVILNIAENVRKISLFCSRDVNNSQQTTLVYASICPEFSILHTPRSSEFEVDVGPLYSDIIPRSVCTAHHVTAETYVGLHKLSR